MAKSELIKTDLANDIRLETNLASLIEREGSIRRDIASLIDDLSEATRI